MTTFYGRALTLTSVLISFQLHKQCLQNINSIIGLSSCGFWMKPHRAKENLPWSIFPFHQGCLNPSVPLPQQYSRAAESPSKTPQPALTSIINLSGTSPPYIQKDRQSSPLCSDFSLISDQGVGKILWSKSWHCSGFWRVMVLVGKQCFLKKSRSLNHEPKPI